MKECGNRIYI